jgi:hypothetical protein
MRLLAIGLAVLTTACGQLAAASSESIPVVGVDWRWSLLLDASGRVVMDLRDADGDYSIFFKPEGSLHVIAGCAHSSNGTYELRGSRLALRVVQGEACREGRMFTQLLGRVDSLTTDDRGLVLHLRDGWGTMIFRAVI